MVRYPLGGMLSCVLQWLAGFKQLGHDVYFVEQADYSNACYDPAKNVMGDDCAFGTAAVDALLAKYDLQARWCFVDVQGSYYGLSSARVSDILRSADLFVDMGTHGAWLAQAKRAGRRIFVDGEPGFRQMRMEHALAAGKALPEYDDYYTTGLNVGTERSTAPTALRRWRAIPNVVAVSLFRPHPVERGAPFTTVMNWRSHKPVEFRGTTYGQKDVEFEKFIDLPRATSVALEVAVAGASVPAARLRAAGWRLRDATEVSRSFESFQDYVARSRGEFSVCKHVFVATNSGWFSDRSGAYLASGRPVVMQDTGFSDCLPSGRGLLAVRTAEEAAAAIGEICGDYARHSAWARELAEEYLDAPKLLKKLLSDLGVS